MSNPTTLSVRRPSVTKHKPSQPFDMDKEIRASKELTRPAKLLLLAITDHARHGRSKCTASTATLARESVMSDRHVRRLLPILEKGGWIQVERATGSRQSRHTIYLAPRDDSVPFVKLHEVGHSGPCSRTGKAEDRVSHPYEGFKRGEEVGRVGSIQQNYNPPSPPPAPDDDPEETRRAIAAIRAMLVGRGGVS